jgi:Tol biopolymer transport system component
VPFYSSADGIGPPVWLNDGKAMLVVLDDKAGRGRIWEISYPQGQAHPVTHDLEDYDVSLGATRDAKTIAAVSVTETANLYVAQTADLSHLHQITFGDQLIDYVTSGPNDRLLIHSAENPDGELWNMNGDGSQTALFTKHRNVGFPSLCGSFVLFVAREKETEELIRVDSDGLNPKKLASGNVWSPSCSPDGRFIFYADLSTRPQRILRISIDGGQPAEIAKVPGKWMVGSLSLSQNGKMLAYPYQEDQPNSSSNQLSCVLVVIPSDGGTPIKTFPNVLGYVRWAPGGGGLDYYDLRDVVPQIMEQPLAGGPLRQLTKFSGGRSGGFQWSLDGKQLYVTHGELKSNVVLITNFR